jgi:formylglycine-generating enzyme required for sulfatase activity
LKKDGTVVAWGDDGDHQIEVPAGLSGVTAISAGDSHNLALKEDGTVVAWGDNRYGQASVPAGLSGVTAIAAGGWHSLALKNDGTVVAWGFNTYGQLNIPAGLSGVTAIAAGEWHSLALKNDGTVVAWGMDADGATNVPAGLNGVTAVAAGFRCSMALKNDGTVVAWPYPETFPILYEVAAIAAGQHQLMLKNNGTVEAWGYNGYGQSTVPAGLSGVTAIAAGTNHSLAIVNPNGLSPSTTITFNPDNPDGQNGWYVSNVHITVAAKTSSGGSDVAETRCVLDPSIVPLNFDDLPSGCAYTGNGADVTLDGKHTIYAASIDTAGNKEIPTNKQVNIDTTLPMITAVATNADNTPYSAGTWTNQTVTVHFTCNDIGSGIKSCPADQTFDSDGVWPPVNGTAIDIAGNSANVSFGPIQIQKAPSEPTYTISPKDGMDLIEVPAGNFLMGSTQQEVDDAQSGCGYFCNGPAFNDELPQHTVYLDTFLIDKTHVTNTMYALCVAAGTCQPPSSSDSYTHSNYYNDQQYANYPVINVSWYDAENYCAWAGRQLPTEAQYEKAARGTDGRIYPWGNQPPAGNLVNGADVNVSVYEFPFRNPSVNDGYADIAPVGTYPAGASPYGALDMVGNVTNWVADWYNEDYYATSPSDNPTGPENGQVRVSKGGTWNSAVVDLRVARRHVAPPNYSQYTVGFRCAVNLINPNRPPTAYTQGPYDVNEGSSVTLTANGTDSNGGLLAFAWDLDNDGTFETPGQTVIFSAANRDGPDSQIVSVQVTDNSGLSATAQSTINITNVAPTANLSNNGPINSGSPVTITFSNQYDPSTADTAAAFHYAFDCSNNSLAGSTYANSSASPTTTCTYNDGPSTHTVIGRIIDKDDGFTEYTTPVQVNNATVILKLLDSTGKGLSGGTGQYYDGAWKSISGNTDSNGVLVTDIPVTKGNLTFRMIFAGGVNDQKQNVSTGNSIVVFQTVNVSVQLQDHTGKSLDTGTVQYYAGSWLSFGTTSSGTVSKELLPNTYSFRMIYAGGSNDKSQNIATNSTVVFQTVVAAVQLQNHAGVPLDTGTVQYYAGSWLTFGTTSGGTVSKELLPNTYSFRMTYGGGPNDKSQNIATNSTVVFQTVNVTVQLQNHAGLPFDTGTVQYYAGSWLSFGTTSGGTVSKELLPNTYSFRMTYAGGNNDKSQAVAANNSTVIFQTSQVHSDSGKCAQYYAGSWRTFTQDMELLPISYTFRFSDGTKDTSYTIAAGSTNHIH